MSLKGVSRATHMNGDSVTQSAFLTDRKQSHSFFAFQVKYFSSLSWAFPNCGLLSHTSGQYLQIDVWAASPPLCDLSRSSVPQREACRWRFTSSWFYKNRNWSLSQKQTSGVRGNDLVTQELILVFSSQPCAHLSRRKLPPSPAKYPTSFGDIHFESKLFSQNPNHNFWENKATLENNGAALPLGLFPG